MKRHVKILEHALGSVLRKRGKTVSTAAALVLVVTILASVLFLTHSLRREADALLQGAPAVVVQRLLAGRHELIPVAAAEKIREIPGVGAVTPRYWGYYYDALTGANYTVLGAAGVSSPLAFLQGRLPNSGEECAVGAGVAGVKHLKVGDELVLVDGRNAGVTYQVSGVFESPSSLLTDDLVVLTEPEVIRFFGFPEGLATDLAAEVFNDAETGTVAQKIKAFVPDTRPITRTEIRKTYDAAFNWRSGMMLAVFLAAAVAFCILAWDKATGISAEERQEIGVLKAIGWDTSDVLELKLLEGLSVSLASLLLGLALAYVHVFWFGAPLLSPILKGWSVLFPDFRLPPEVNLYQVAVVAFFTVCPYVASTVVPCWKSAVTDPDSVMRS